MKTKIIWTTDDWCFHAFKLKQIKEINGQGHVQSVSDGYFSSGYNNFNSEIFPLTLHNKRIADEVSNYYNKLHGHKSDRHLNWPDISNHFEQMFINGCNIAEGDKTALQTWYDEIASFYKDVIEKLEALDGCQVDGLKLIR